MRSLIQKIFMPAVVVAVVNIIGYLYHTHYIGAVIGSVLGGIIGLIVSEVRAKFN